MMEELNQKHYAELTLYVGKCPNDMLREGHFKWPTNDQYEKRFYLKGMEVINKYLQLSDNDWVECGRGFVGNECNARMLINYAEENIPYAYGVIELWNSMHGAIVFERKIRFDGMTRDQEINIIKNLQKSGFDPKSRKREEIEKRLENVLWKDETLKLLEEVDADEFWENIIRFY